MWLVSKRWSNLPDGFRVAEALEEQARKDWRETFQAAVVRFPQLLQRIPDQERPEAIPADDLDVVIGQHGGFAQEHVEGFRGWRLFELDRRQEGVLVPVTGVPAAVAEFLEEWQQPLSARETAAGIAGRQRLPGGSECGPSALEAVP